METKSLALSNLELKFTDGMKFSGYASIFGGVDSYNDTIAKGAYAETIGERQRPIRMRWNHHGDIIGKWTVLKEDAKGLYVEGELTPNHSKASDVYASLKHGAIDGMSIGYRVKDYEQTENIRLLKKIDLIEISIVEEPADLGAKIASVKSEIEQFTSLKEFETLLRDAGRFTKEDATALVSRIKSIARRDADAEIKTKQELERIFSSVLSQH
jgi:HK97 family phage prohead protease